jgi:membrane-associated protease RseP (regulator of RpoE activity)
MIAIILMFFVLSFAGNPNKAQPTTTIAAVSHSSAAAAAGLRTGDTIVAIDDKPVTSWNGVRNAVRHSVAGRQMLLTFERDGQRRTVGVVPVRDPSNGNVPMLGVVSKIVLGKTSLPGAVVGSFGETAHVGQLSVQGLVQIFSPSGVHSYTNQLSGNHSTPTAGTGGTGAGSSTNDDSKARFVSLIGITRYAGQAVQAGWVSVFLLLITINVFVGIFNMIPLLPFDGGLVAIAVYEKIASSISGRKVEVDIRKLVPITAAVVAVLLFIGISAMYLDIVRPL